MKIEMHKISDLVNDAEFTECINKAMPYRIKIIKEISPEMKGIQKAFIELMETTITVNGKTGADAIDSIDYNEWRKGMMKLFRTTLKVIHPNENQTPGIGMLYVAGSLLTYIKREDLIFDNPNFSVKDSLLTFRKFEDIYPILNNDDARRRMIAIFNEADIIQGEMCEASDMIKKTFYEQLPPLVKYEKDGNRHGIKPAQFALLVKHAAMKALKSADKYKDYIMNHVDNSNCNIIREELMLEKSKQM